MPYQSHPGSEEESVSGRSGKAQASPSLCPTIPQVVEGKQVLSGAKSYETTLQETWCPASPVESWGGLKAVIRIFLYLFRCGCCSGGTPAARHRSWGAVALT